MPRLKILTSKDLRDIRPPKDGSTLSRADVAVPGLSVLIGPSGRARWSYIYRTVPCGPQTRVKLGFVWQGPGEPPTPQWLDISAARFAALKIRNNVEQGVPAPAGKEHSPRASLRLGEMVEKYLADPNVAKLRTAAELRRSLYKECATVWTKPAAMVTRSDIRSILETKGATHIGNRLHGYLGVLFKWAIDAELVSTSPVPSQRPLKVEKSRDRWLDDSELTKVWQATSRLNPAAAAVVKLLVLTGQRREEVAGMRWTDINGEWRISAEDAKNETAHLVPLAPAARAIIEAQPHLGEFVFTVNGEQSVNMSQVGTILSNATPDLPAWRLHDLRRSVATGMQKLGVSTNIADRCLNHATIKGAGRAYLLHEYLPERREAMERWAAHIAGLIGPQLP